MKCLKTCEEEAKVFWAHKLRGLEKVLGYCHHHAFFRTNSAKRQKYSETTYDGPFTADDIAAYPVHTS
jgi:hypothetical protein